MMPTHPRKRIYQKRIDRRSDSAAVSRKIFWDPIYLGRMFWGGFGGLFFEKFAKFHYKIIKSLVHTRKQLTEIIVPRGFGKTKLVTVLYTIWSVFIRKRKYVILISYSQHKSGLNLLTIKNCLRNPMFRRAFPWKKLVWSKYLIQIEQYDGTISTIESKGIMQPIFGASIGAARPDLIIMDDLEDLKIAKNIERVRDLVDWFDTEIDYALSARDAMGREGQLVLIGTPLDPNSFLAKAMTWGMNIQKYPALVEMKEPGSDIIEFQGKFYKSIWPDMRPTQSIIDKWKLAIKRGAVAAFDSQMMLDPSKMRILAFKREMMVPLEKKTKDRNIAKKAYDIKVTIDMAYTQETYSDYIGIVVAGHYKGSRCDFLQSMRGKWDQDELFDILIDIRTNYPGFDVEFYVESNSYKVIEAFFRERAIRKRIPALRLAPVIRPSKYYTQNKNDRFGMLVPYWNNGLTRVYVEENYPLISDLTSWDGKNAKDLDVGDAASFHVFFFDESLLIESYDVDDADLRTDAAAAIKKTYDDLEKAKGLLPDESFDEYEPENDFFGYTEDFDGYMDNI